MVNLSSMIAKAIAITGMGDQIPWVSGIILKLPPQTADNDSQVFPVSLGLLTPDRDDKNEWKRRATVRPSLRSTASVLDPTEERRTSSGTLVPVTVAQVSLL